jgi:hypothetical protein
MCGQDAPRAPTKTIRARIWDSDTLHGSTPPFTLIHALPRPFFSRRDSTAGRPQPWGTPTPEARQTRGRATELDLRRGRLHSARGARRTSLRATTRPNCKHPPSLQYLEHPRSASTPSISSPPNMSPQMLDRLRTADTPALPAAAPA